MVKGLALSLLWLRLLLWFRFNIWPGNFYMPWTWPKKNKKQKRNTLEALTALGPHGNKWLNLITDSGGHRTCSFGPEIDPAWTWVLVPALSLAN